MSTVLRKTIFIILFFTGLGISVVLGQDTSAIYISTTHNDLPRSEMQNKVFSRNPDVVGLLISDSTITLVSRDSSKTVTYRVKEIFQRNLVTRRYVCYDDSVFIISHMFLEPRTLTDVRHYTKNKVVQYY